MRLAAIARLVSMVFVLFAAFALVFTVTDSVVDARHAHWPVTTATIRAAEIGAYHPFTRDGGGTVYAIDARSTFEVAGHPVVARLGSESVRNAGGSPVMRDWITRHQAGAAVAVRYNPDDPQQAELVDPEGLPMPRHPRQDALLTSVAALLALCFAGASQLRGRPT